MSEMPATGQKRSGSTGAVRHGSVPEVKWKEFVAAIESVGWVLIPNMGPGTHQTWEREGKTAKTSFSPSLGGGKLKEVANLFDVEFLLHSDRRSAQRAARTTHRRSRKPIVAKPVIPVDQIEPGPGAPAFWAQVVPIRADGMLALLDKPADETCARCAGSGVVTCPTCFAETKDMVIFIVQGLLAEIGHLRAEIRERDERQAIRQTGVLDEKKRRMYDKLKVLVQDD